MKRNPFLLAAILTVAFYARCSATNIIHQTSFEAPAFRSGLPIRGQDNWEMFSDGEAISVATNNARTGVQCLRMAGALLEQVGPNSSRAYCFSRALTAIATNPPIVELTVYARLDGPQTGTNGAPADDKMSANLVAVAEAGGETVILGQILVSSAGRIFTTGSRSVDSYKFSAPMSFGVYQKLVLRVDFIARTVRYFANDVELGSVSFEPLITSDRLVSGYLYMAGPTAPFSAPYHYDPADYTVYFDDYSIASIPLAGAKIIVEQPAGTRLATGAATVDFGGGMLGAGSQRTFTIRNIGSADLTGVTVTFDGPQAAEFTVSASPAATVGASGSTTFTVTFTPAAAVARTAALHIASSDGNENPFSIALTGTGLTPGTIAQQAYLKASNTGIQDAFGNSVAVSGDTVVVGSYNEDSNATGVNGNQSNNSALYSGAAYVFVRNGTNWTQQAYLKASNTGADDNFGWSVGVWGDTVVVGAPAESSNATGVNGNQSNNSAPYSGAAYVFVRNGTNWTQQAYLKASNTATDDNFGWSVAASWDTILIGAGGEASNALGVNGNQDDNSAPGSGAAYVFVRNGTNWSQQAYLKASNTEAGDGFGSSVAVDGDAVVVGALYESSSATGVNGNQEDNSASGSGAAYVFVRSGTNWTQQAYLKASNTGADDYFGMSVALSGDTVIVGAGEASNATGVNGNQNDNSAPGSGAAYVFARNGTNWSQQAYLKASNTGMGDFFGGSVAVDADTVLVGALYESSSATGVNGNQGNHSAAGSGAAYIFVRSGTNWSQLVYLKPSNTGAGDYFATSVAVDGDTVAVGANGEDSNVIGVTGNQNNNSSIDSGAAYVFTGVHQSTPVPTFGALSVTRDPGGAIRLALEVFTGRTYTLQGSENLLEWADVATQPATTNRIEFIDTPTASFAQRFYRVKED